MTLALHIAAAWITASLSTAFGWYLGRATRTPNHHRHPEGPRPMTDRLTVDSINSDQLDALYDERDALLAELDGRDAEARERWIQKQLDETGLKAMDFRNGMSMEIEPAREMVAHWVGAARAMLDDAPNYSETPIEMEVKVGEGPERFAFVLQRVGKLTPHQARQQAEAERDGAYRERAHLVALLAAMTDGAVIASAPDVDEPGWQIVYLTIDGRQASWHISPRDAELFQCVPHVDADHPKAQWDGHTTDDKYADIRQHTRALFHQCGPACAEGHTYTGRCARP